MLGPAMESLAQFLGLSGTMAGNDLPEAPQEKSRVAGLSGPAFSRAVIASQEYRQSILDRVKLGSLAPAVECRLLDHAFGKPADHVEISDPTSLENQSVEQLEARALLLAALARNLRKQSDPAPQDEPGAVH